LALEQLFVERLLAGGCVRLSTRITSLLPILMLAGAGWRTAGMPVSGEPRAVPARAGRGGTVTGKVTFTGRVPSNPVMNMRADPRCAARYQTMPHLQLVVVNPNGTLANVFVYVKTGLPDGATYPAPTSPVVLQQTVCEHHPRVFGIMVGQPLEVRNSDPLLHNIRVLATQNASFNLALPTAGTTVTRTFTAPEVMLTLVCDAHGWMRAYAGVLPHPFFATTGTDGQFTIDGLPPGTYTVEAWHETFGTRRATITVNENATATVDFAYNRP